MGWTPTRVLYWRISTMYSCGARSVAQTAGQFSGPTKNCSRESSHLLVCCLYIHVYSRTLLVCSSACSDGFEISVVYQRCCYHPSHFRDEKVRIARTLHAHVRIPQCAKTMPLLMIAGLGNTPSHRTLSRDQVSQHSLSSCWNQESSTGELSCLNSVSSNISISEVVRCRC